VTEASRESQFCNQWATRAPQSRYYFGQNSKCKMLDATDGSSNSFVIAETTRDVYNGRPPTWGYRGWVMAGLDPGYGINVWTYSTITPIPGRVGSWGYAGSLHPGGCHFAMGDASVRYVRESVAAAVLAQVARIGDGVTANLD
jgi:hypothetical protein